MPFETKVFQKAKVLAVTLLLLALAGVTAAEMYKLENVKRVDQDVYTTSDGLVIKTRYCYHYTYGEDAIYDDQDKKIIWKNGDSPCEVEGIYK